MVAIHNTKTGRRAVLKGLSLGASTAILQPFLSRLALAADGQLPPPRFLFVVEGMIGGLTNVATIASGVGFPYFSIQFQGLGIDMPKHNIGHALYLKDDVTGWELSQKIRAFHFQLIARFMQKLQSVPEGDGTMLDNTVIVYLSDGAETHHSRCFEWPFVVLGNARGKLKTNGQYVVLPDYGRPGHRTINTLYTALLHAAGTPRDDFGSPDPNLDTAMFRGPLPELLV
jgi:hypothetical protein